MQREDLVALVNTAREQAEYASHYARQAEAVEIMAVHAGRNDASATRQLARRVEQIAWKNYRNAHRREMCDRTGIAEKNAGFE